MSLIFISTLSLNGCIALTLVGGVVGGVDSISKEIKIRKLETQIEEIIKEKEEESKPYVPSYHDMDILGSKL